MTYPHPSVLFATLRCTALLAAIVATVGCASTPLPRSTDSADARPVASKPHLSPSPAPKASLPQIEASPPATVPLSPSAPASPETATSPVQEAIETAPGEQGVASWYGPRFHGRKTASGERFNTNDLTAAHKTLPFGTRVRVTSLVNGREVVVRINDRGPFIRGRIIDLSHAAAKAIGLSGVKPVKLELLR
jgi:rare lipoprotein A